MQAYDFTAPLRAFITRRMPSGMDPDDIVQEVFVRIHERLPELRDTERLDASISKSRATSSRTCSGSGAGALRSPSAWRSSAAASR